MEICTEMLMFCPTFMAKYVGILNQMKSFTTSRIARQLCFAFTNCINYGIEVFDHCADECLCKSQTLQNINLKLMLKLGRRRTSKQRNRDLSLLKVSDIHAENVLCLVNNCRRRDAQRRFVITIISWWRHQMETLSAPLALCAGNSPMTGEFPWQSQWRGVLMFSLIFTRINVE